MMDPVGNQRRLNSGSDREAPTRGKSHAAAIRWRMKPRRRSMVVVDGEDGVVGGRRWWVVVAASVRVLKSVLSHPR
jgi:hypothetical protein